MNCRNFELYSSLYIDDMLLDADKTAFEQHLKECNTCNMAYKHMQVIIEATGEIEDIELPLNFNTTLRQRLNEANEKRPKRKWKTWMALASAAAIIALSTIAFDGVNLPNMRKSSTDYLTRNVAPMEMADFGGQVEEEGISFTASHRGNEVIGDQQKAEVGLSATIADTSMKLIHQGSLRLQTSQFDETYSEIVNLLSTYNGYFQHSEIFFHRQDRDNPDESLRSASLSLRVPSHNFMEVFEFLKTLGVVVNQNISTRNITEEYYDIENQALNLEIQEERLREIMQKADKVEDLLRIENELSRIRFQINSLRGTLRQYDKLVSLSTIDVGLEEIKAPVIRIQSVNEGIWGKAKANFINSINTIINLAERGFIISFTFLPILILFSIPIILYWIIKKGRFKK